MTNVTPTSFISAFMFKKFCAGFGYIEKLDWIEISVKPTKLFLKHLIPSPAFLFAIYILN
jgi:hypothetical protein